MTMYTPFTDDEPGQAATFNLRFAEMEAAITAGAGLMRTRTAWTTLETDQAEIEIDVSPGDNTLQLMTTLRTDYAGGATDNILVVLNDDTSSTYTTRCGLVNSGAGGSVVDASGVTGFTVSGGAASNTAVAGGYGFMKMTFPLASDVSVRNVLYDAVVGGAYASFVMGGGYYSAVATIAKITIRPVSGTVFLAGCRYALFGVN